MTTGQTLTLGLKHHQAGRLRDAEECYRQILAAEPNHADALHHLGILAHQSRHYDVALELIRRATILAPENPSAHFNLGEVCRLTGRPEEAIGHFHRALELRPDYAASHYHLGHALREQGQLDAAVTAYRRALALKSDYAEACNGLGGTLAMQRQFDPAVAALRQALRLKPDYAEACNNLAGVLAQLGQVEEAAVLYHKAVALDPRDPAILSNLILVMPLCPTFDEKSIREEQVRWNRLYVEPLRPSLRPHDNDRSPRRRLKIGYVSPDFRSHALAFFLAPLLEAHDHEAFEIHCYASVHHPDAITERIRKSADAWHDVRALSDVQLAERVRDDGIDILVDLSMHAADNRLPAFARKPAPVQLSWLSYPGSSGMEMIDYWLTDAHIEMPDTKDDGLGGQAILLPDAWCCYAPIEEFPPVSSLPAAQSGTVTFGSLNQFGKIQEGLLHCWARLLKTVPASRLLMICPEGQTQSRTLAFLSACGVTPDRLELIAPCSWADYIRLFERVDLALDAFPWNGMTTTCHALWMGVPTVTWAGKSAASRAGSSPLHTVGLSEWVAQSEEAYIRIAAEQAADLPRLTELRATLRARMQASPLMDAPRFARHVESAHRTIWQRWCADNRPRPR